LPLGSHTIDVKESCMNTRPSSGLGCIAVALSICAAAASAQPAASAAAGGASAAASAQAGQSLARADKAFFTDAAQAGLAEIESSKLALAKGVNTQVKGFAQQMIDDHTRASQELASLASSKGVTLPTEPSLAQRAKIKLLSARDGAGFDRQYASGMGVSAHEDAIKLFQKTARNASDADVKAFAAKTLPTLEHHLQMARDMKAVVDKEGNAKAPNDRKQ
jgi:putative membrane protein